MEEREDIIEKMRMIRDKREKEIFETNQEENRQMSVEQVQYLGKMEFMEEIDGEKKMIKKDVFMLTEKNDDMEYLKTYDEDMNLLGVEIPATNQTLATKKSKDKDPEIVAKLKRMNKEGKTLEELEEENKEDEKNKEEEIGQDLATDGQDLKITFYRKFVDKTFMSEFPETCQGTKEIGMAYSETLKSYILVANYGDKFEIAKGTEPAKASMKQVYSKDRSHETVEKESPHALMPIKGNGYKNGTKELSITIGQYGYVETQVVDVSRENKRVGKDIREQGEGSKEEKPMSEKRQERAWGIEKTRNEIDLIENKNNPDIDEMKQRIIGNMLEQYGEELNSLYRGNEKEILVSLNRRIEKAVRNGKNIEKDIQIAVEQDINEDIEGDIGDTRSNRY